MNIRKAIKKLERGEQLEGSEIGEAWHELLNIRTYDYCFSDDFNNAVKNEIIAQAESFEIIGKRLDFKE